VTVGNVWLRRLPAVLLLLVLPFLLGTFRLGLLTEVLIFGLLAASLDLLVGFTGLPSLGHATYFGVGGYAAALIARDLTSNVLVGLLVGIVVAVLVAAVTGWLAVRTRGVYFLMLTLAFAQLLFSLALTWQPVTGGSNGLSLPTIELFPGIPLTTALRFYSFSLAIFAVCYLGLRRVVDSPFGRSIAGVRENEDRMRSLGYSTLRYKLASFVIAGAFGGVAGTLFAYFQRFISPDNVAFEISALALIMVIVGGVGTLYGPIIGAALVLLLRDELSARFENWEIMLGAVFVLFVYFLPMGLGGLAQRVAILHPLAGTPRGAAGPEEVEL
jgi:branched-chain amino acid transport system permease protein